MTFTVTRSGVLTGTDTVDVATSDDTATTADGDYTANSTTLTFNPNDTTMTFTVDLTADSKVELDEMFNVTLSNPSTGGVIGDGDGVGTIVNDDGASITINDVSQQEGDSRSPDFTFTATLDFAVDVPVTLDYVSADNTATIGDSDYSTSSGQLSFDGTASETETVTVSVNGDTKVELDETFFVNLSNLAASGRNVTIGDSQGEGTIENDDSASLTINDVSQDEGDVATTSFLFTVTLNNEVDTAFSVDFDSADVKATVADSDYAANSGTLNFAGRADETQTITIDVTGDTTAEVDETFFVNLSNVSAGGRNLTIDDSQGLWTIVNDDNALVVQKVCLPPELATGPFTITVYEGSLGGTLVDTLILNCGEGNTTNPIQVVPGATYVVAEETPPADTFLTYGGDCSADGRVVIDAGIVTCTVTNTEILPFLKFTDPEDEELASNEVFSWFVQVPLSTGSWSLIDWLPFGITLAGPIVEPAGVSCSEVLVFGFTCQGSDTGNVVIEVPVRAPAYCQTFTNTAFLTVDGGPAVTATDQVSVEDCALRKSGHASFPFSSGRRVA